MRIVFSGTPEFAAGHLKILLDSRHEVAGVYTQPDRASGRGRKLMYGPVKQMAMEAEIPVFQPASLGSKAVQDELSSLKPDLMVVVAYGLLLPQEVLDIPVKGCINVHASLLPRWRGAAPIQCAIAASDTQTGITIMQMDAGLDTGDMLSKVYCSIGEADTAGKLHDRLLEIGPELLLKVIDQIENGTSVSQKQDESEATYAQKLTKDGSRIDWSAGADEICRRIKAFNPWPVAWSVIDESRVRILDAEVIREYLIEETHDLSGLILSHNLQNNGKALYVKCGRGVLKLTQLQMPGKKHQKTEELLNGHHDMLEVGKKFV